METYSEPKALVENPLFSQQRRKCLGQLRGNKIDAPIVDIIDGFNQLPCCFTMQSCYGHFVFNGQRDPYNLDPLPDTKNITRVEYRIAYITLCIENSASGRMLIELLKGISDIDPQNIQFCCAEWFWRRQVNSYALQVEPDRFKHADKAILNYNEALQIEKIRNKFFEQLKEIPRKLTKINRIE